MTTRVICDTNCQYKVSKFFLNTQIFIDEDRQDINDRGCLKSESSQPRQIKWLQSINRRKFCALYSQYGKDSILLGCLAYNCRPVVVNRSSILKKLKAGDRNIFKAYTSHCRYKGKWHKGIYTRRLIEFAVLFIK